MVPSPPFSSLMPDMADLMAILTSASTGRTSTSITRRARSTWLLKYARRKSSDTKAVGSQLSSQPVSLSLPPAQATSQ